MSFEKNQTAVFVADITLAAALIAVGVEQIAPASVHEDGHGNRRVLFTFKPYDSDRIVDVAGAAKVAINSPATYIQQNPTNPLSFALAALMQFAHLQRGMDEARPVVAMTTKQPGGPTMHFAKDSRKHQAAIKAGLVPVEVQPPQSNLTKLCTYERTPK